MTDGSTQRRYSLIQRVITEVVRDARGNAANMRGADTNARRLVFVIRAAVYILLSTWLMSSWTPFGVGDVLDRFSRVITNRVFGGAYPESGRREISVALLSDHTLNQRDQSWPAPFNTHAQILRRIATYNPRAVMVDFLFVDERRGDRVGVLTDVIDYYDEKKIRIFFASLAGSADKQLLQDLRDRFAKPGYAVPVSVTLVSEGTQSAVRETVGVSLEAALTYPEESHGLESAAFRIYRDLSTKNARYRASVERLPRPAPDLEVIWGTNPSEHTNRWWHCQDIPESIIPRILTAIFRPSALLQSCPYSDSFDVTELLGRNFDDEKGAGHGADDDLRKLIEHRVVFYGADFLASSDQVVTPTHGVLPSVFVHAMALDNLISFQDEYIKNSFQWAGIVVDKQTIENFISIITIIAILLYWEFLSPKIRDENPDETLKNTAIFVGKLALLFVIIVVMVISVCIFAFSVLDLPPMNWLGMLSLFTLVVTLSRLHPLEGILMAILGIRRQQKSPFSPE